MGPHELVLMTDHSSTEGSRETLSTAVRLLTGRVPVQLDARHFMTGGTGRISSAGPGGAVRLEVPAEGVAVTAEAVLVYEIPPHRRRDFEPCQRQLRAHGVRSLGTDAEAWRAATEKDRTVERFARDGIPQMPTIALSRPSPAAAVEAFDRLGGDVWARPTVGMGGNDVFHLTTRTQLAAAADHYAGAGADWLLARDAGNFTADGRRHQYRVVVLAGRVVRAVEHVQPDPDAPCNECQGAVSTLLTEGGLPAGLAELAVSATKSLGLPLAGVDLAAENGGVVFEVNVHPVFGTVDGLETVAVPYAAAHLAPR
ncbi:alpha-L-glutamate ligase [Streptomyces sp. CB01881]|uniref:ATP-grasp domain-containing protein n=1 Tax=Streptomyces sp. CB01881 TaxID=2078691 RepID=UPI000CDC9C1D|nr:alpha-L-glutamate ligase [Streptomyces sp. CB01881]AUY47884.1 alpha-L-glutamate ligase [Streptomyces sp. CB01881]TYC76358.1 alpha-L-glutamate ligase [Streptomyces sp. CB01881]